MSYTSRKYGLPDETCPLIDEVIGSIEGLQNMQKVLEDIRSANGTLRDIAMENIDLVEKLKYEISDLENKLEKVESELEDANKRIEELENQLV